MAKKKCEYYIKNINKKNMRNFVNIKEEFPVGHPDRYMFIKNNIIDRSLNDKINSRGLREQYACVFLNHYHVDDPIIQRKRRSTFFKKGVYYVNMFNKYKSL